MAVVQGEEDKSGAATGRSAAASRLTARRAAKAAAKASKRGTAPIVPGKVTKSVGAAKAWFDANQRTMLFLLAVVVLGGGAAYAVSTQYGKRDHQAADLLGTGLSTANAPIIKAGEEPPGDAPEESYPTAQARAEKARDAFAAVANRFPDSKAATWARLGQANALSELGKQAEAEKLYAAIADQQGGDSFVRFRALEGLGFTLEAEQKYDAANKRFAQIGEIDNGAFKPVSDYQQARMLIALGNKQKAADMLQALVKGERAKPSGEGGTRFESVVAEAETLLTELAVELNAPKLRPETPAGGAPGMGMGAAAPSSPHAQGAGLTKEIVEALRKQLESGKGDKGLTKDIVDQLDRQVQSGDTSGKTVQIPAPKQAPAKSGKGAQGTP
jgi:tetratricopeptide (TPR) repeat protein